VRVKEKREVEGKKRQKKRKIDAKNDEEERTEWVVA